MFFSKEIQAVPDSVVLSSLKNQVLFRLLVIVRTDWNVFVTLASYTCYFIMH